MGSADKTKKLLNTLENDERVYISTICPFSDRTIDDSTYVAAFAEKTNGIVYTQADYRNYGDNQESQSVQNKIARSVVLSSNVEDSASAEIGLK